MFLSPSYNFIKRTFYSFRTRLITARLQILTFKTPKKQVYLSPNLSHRFIDENGEWVLTAFRFLFQLILGIKKPPDKLRRFHLYRSNYAYNSLKKSFPLSSTMINAGKFSTLILRTASIPRSSKSTTSTDLILFLAKIAAGPPIDPR